MKIPKDEAALVSRVWSVASSMTVGFKDDRGRSYSDAVSIIVKP